MKNIYLLIIFVIAPFYLLAQMPEIPSANAEQQLEAATENNDDVETEDDSFVQKRQHFLTDPINLNNTDATELNELNILSPLQIQNFISYRNMLGIFIDIYELQAVPGWNIYTIKRLQAYVTIKSYKKIGGSIYKRLKGGVNTVLVRGIQVVEQSNGYKNTGSTTINSYTGSPQRFYIRYKYQYKNLLQYGLVAEKDAGEQFFKGTQKQGFDFYSAHFFVRNIGIIKSLALGDFAVNMGQGLTQWQSLAFKKSSDVTNTKRQLAVLRPYNSAGEINFHRGLGITLAKNNIEATVFISYKNIDANFVQDTLNSENNFISSLQTSGLHRTKTEIADKGVQKQFAFGGNIVFNKNNFHFGFSAIQYRFKLPLNKAADPYNLYALQGKIFGNSSVDYSYTFKNLHFYGEAATTNNFTKAFVNGLIISVDARVDMSLVYRNISKQYQSLYTNAFTENSLPTNEKGLYAGITIRPNDFWRIDAYADFYKFPWLKYSVNAPSTGRDFMVMATYKPNKLIEIYIRYRNEMKAKNYNPNLYTISPVLQKPKQNLRAQLSYKINTAITFRNRLEMVWFDKTGSAAQNGFLSYAEIIYKPMQKKYSGNFRVQYFETDGYDSRLYAYENDVLYSFSIPVFYDKGLRYYLNFNYDINKKLLVWLRWAQTINKDKVTIGTGLDQISGPNKSEAKIQFIYLF